jgi:hypothetical protein
MARLLATQPYTNTNPIFQVLPGQYRNFYLFFDGTSSTGQTSVIGDVNGPVTATKNGIPFVASVSAINLMHIANMRGGRVQLALGTATTTQFFIPIMLWDQSAPNNGMLVTENDLVNIAIALPAGWATHIVAAGGAGTWYLFGDNSDCIQNYIPILTQFTYSGVTAVKDRLQAQNVSRLFINNMDDTDLTRLQIVIDQKLVHDLTRTGALAISNFSNQVEDVTALVGAVTANVFAELPVAINGAIGEFLNDSIEISMQGGGGAFSPEVITLGYMFTPDAQVVSESKVHASAVASIKRQPVSTVQVIRQIATKNRAEDVLASAGV